MALDETPTPRTGPILLVEDDADVRFSIRAILEDAGYRVVEAEDGRAALDYLLSDGEEPCVIVLDLLMPRMTGGEFATILAKYHRLARIPVVIASVFDPARYGTTHFSGYLKKPFDLVDLCAMVRRLSPRPLAET